VATVTDAIFNDLAIPPHSTLRFAITYHVPASRRADAPRFTIAERRGQRIVGGSTWVIRRR